MPTDPSDLNYGLFCEMVTGYRQLAVIMAAVECGVIDAVAAGPCSRERLLQTTGMQAAEGGRFLTLLMSAGILRETEGGLALSPFADTYLRQSSELSQRGVLEFEGLLQGRWGRLGELLATGQGSVVEEQSPDAYRQRLSLFHRAMHGAAVVRSGELWDALGTLAPAGTIIDAGAGDCTYLTSFLQRHAGWRALACDLGDVLEAVVATERLSTHSCNLLDPVGRREFVAGHRGGADLLLLSNFIHCYGQGEVTAMLPDLGELVTPDGLLVVHDFFTDGNGFSALYDLHMLVNTYNGRTYSFAETGEMLAAAGFTIRRRLELPSHSHALVAGRDIK